MPKVLAHLGEQYGRSHSIQERKEKKMSDKVNLEKHIWEAAQDFRELKARVNHQSSTFRSARWPPFLVEFLRKRLTTLLEEARDSWFKILPQVQELAKMKKIPAGAIAGVHAMGGDVSGSSSVARVVTKGEKYDHSFYWSTFWEMHMAGLLNVMEFVVTYNEWSGLD